MKMQDRGLDFLAEERSLFFCNQGKDERSDGRGMRCRDSGIGRMRGIVSGGDGPGDDVMAGRL